MSNRRTSVRFALLLPVLWFGAHSSRAQSSIFVGADGFDGGPAPVTGVETFIQTGYAAYQEGNVDVAGFSWSQAPCPGAVKIKFFHFSNSLPFGGFIYLEQRGPFDVTSTRQRVRLDPPVALKVGDVIAITNVTSCGGPVIAGQIDMPGPLPPPGPYYVVSGDVTSNVVPSAPRPNVGPAVTVFAVDQGLLLLNGRFRITLMATNPRTGAVTPGYPIALGDPSSGYFSLPDFTNNFLIPEVVVKMVDATSAPALGGNFWFFHAPLTDTHYIVTVMDQTNGTVRTYTNTSGAPGQLCGGVDTSAFPP